MTPAEKVRAEVLPALLIFLRTIVEDSNAIQIDVEPIQHALCFFLRVAPKDVGIIIGQGGRTARALRTLLLAASQKYDVKISLEIVEPDGERHSPALVHEPELSA